MGNEKDLEAMGDKTAGQKIDLQFFQ
jgi:hypothetical protein